MRQYRVIMVFIYEPSISFDGAWISVSVYIDGVATG